MVEIRSRHGEKCILMEGRTGSRKYGTCQQKSSHFVTIARY